MSPDEQYLLARAPIELTMTAANTALLKAARGLANAGLARLEPIEGRNFGDGNRVKVWITRAGAEAYARAVAR